jgi:hypothetical protein
MDDIIVYSRTFDQHVEDVRVVLQRLQQAGLTILPRKYI